MQGECEAGEAEEQRKGGKLAKLEEAVAELDKGLVKIRTQVDIKKSSIKDEEGRVTACKAELTQVRVAVFFCLFYFINFLQLEASLTEKKAQVEEINASHKTVKDKGSVWKQSLTELSGGQRSVSRLCLSSLH